LRVEGEVGFEIRRISVFPTNPMAWQRWSLAGKSKIESPRKSGPLKIGSPLHRRVDLRIDRIRARRHRIEHHESESKIVTRKIQEQTGQTKMDEFRRDAPR
jgi:hypothetical protein